VVGRGFEITEPKADGTLIVVILSGEMSHLGLALAAASPRWAKIVDPNLPTASTHESRRAIRSRVSTCST
jgi:hypothetical protein